MAVQASQAPQQMIFGKDVVTAPIGPTTVDTPNSAYAISPNPFYQAPPTSPVVSSSTPAATVVGNLGTNINSGQNNPPTIPTPSNPFGAPTTPTPYDPNNDSAVQDQVTKDNKIYEDRRAALQAERDAEVARLTGESQTDQTKLVGTQKNETGASNRNLLYLQQGGQSASAQAYLTSLEQSHQTEMNTLIAKYNSAIQTAKNAYADKDFQLAESEVKNAKDIKDAATKRNQDFLDYTLKLRTEATNELKTQMAEQKVVTDAAKDARDYATKTGITQPFYELGGQLFSTSDGTPINSAQDFLAAGGKEDYSNVFVVQPNTNKSYAGGALGEFQYLVDQGQYQPGQFQQYLNQKKADAVAIARAGRGPTAQDLKAEASQAANDMDAKLQARVGQNDTYVSPADWAYYRNIWVKQGNAAADFDKNFVNYANPKDNYIGLSGAK